MSLTSPSQDWMVLQCTACSARMKVRREVALASRLLCPHCRTPVPVAGDAPPVAAEPAAPHSMTGTAASAAPATAPEARSGEFRPSPLPDRGPGASGPGAFPLREGQVLQGRDFSQEVRADLSAEPAPESGSSLPTRRSHHPEFSGATPELNGAEGEEWEEEEETPEHVHPEERRKVRIKKRRAKRNSALRYLELTDWDQRDLTELKEAEIAADPWAEARPLPEDVVKADEENEYVVEKTEDGEGQTRTTKKKVRRRRLMLGARLFFQRFTWISRHFTTGLAVLLASVALYGFHVYRQEYTNPPLPPVADLPLDRAILTEYDTQGADKAVRDFLAADGIEEKLKFVRHPQRVKPLMEKWYRGEKSAAPMQAGEWKERDKRKGGTATETYFILLAMPVYEPDPLNPGSTREEMTFFAVEEIRNGPSSTYLVDWETSTGYQEIPLETYKSTMPPEPYPFRIRMKLDDYYNHGFLETEWQCVQLYYPGREFRLYGYISRTAIQGRKLLDLLPSEGGVSVIAELVYPPDAVSREQVIVSRLLHSSWFFDTPEAAGVLTGDRIPSIR